ncbi:phage holin family protein [Humibacter ginsenosidimutans]|uniref:Phage holin family protein n=1 Tax=Humibacter ginsenosidimutans TaxID=2599293 RepID=A0A5B8M7F9_9MICO|nr:phage holin family protein [Humibacter ginsenosidimutans]QDZ15605.1 phage holin family protein [Humibacter ginsenosidimutans]
MSGETRSEGASDSQRSAGRDRRSLIQLIKDLPGLIVALLKAELAQLKAELVHKATNAGIGIGMFVVAAMLLFFMLGVLVTAAIAGIAVALPVWLSALIVAAGLLVLIAVLVLIGIRMFKRAGQPLKTVDSVKQDVNAVKGLGDYDH